MSKRTKSILMIVAFVVFIAAAVFAYNSLKDRVPRNADIDLNNVIPMPGQIEEPNNEPGANAIESPVSESKAEENEDSETESDNNSEKVKAPDFTVADMDGNSVKLSDMFGKPIVLNFWASWCGPCRNEMPEFNEAYEELKDEIIFMMVDLVDGRRETVEIGKKFIEEQGYTFPVYFDTNQDAANTYGIMYLPTTLFIDKDGYIVTGAQGSIDGASLKKGIEMIK